MVDITPDVSHIEQNTFVLRYLTREQDKYIIRERFFTFVGDSGKTGSEIATMILLFLTENEIPFKDCRGQGYDNASNMSGRYNEVQNILKQENPLCTLSSGCQSKLVWCQISLCCKDAINFFGTFKQFTVYFHQVQKDGIFLFVTLEFRSMVNPIRGGLRELIVSAPSLRIYQELTFL